MKEDLAKLAKRLGERLLSRGEKLVTAESCTGGWVAKTLTDIPGSSAWFDRGFVTYSNQSKQDMLGVSRHTLDAKGAVSKDTVREMARGALEHSQARFSVAISGVAGPGGGTTNKPVGTVCIAWMSTGSEPRAQRVFFSGDRRRVRREAVAYALRGLIELLDEGD